MTDYDLFGNPLKIHISEIVGKTCLVCKQYKVLEDFDFHTGHKDNRDGRCRSCKREQSEIRKMLKRTAPRPKTTVCECCNKEFEPRLIVLDHDHETNLFRGWICHLCNAGIGQLGDTISGLEMAITYLRKHYDNL